MYRTLFLASALSLVASSFAQNNDQRRMEFTIKGTANDTMYLAAYYGKNLYYNDTAVADARGVSVFKRASGYPAGVYALVAPGPRFFEFLVNEPLIRIQSDTADMSGSMKVLDSKENSVFQGYVRYLNTQRKEAEALSKRMETAPNEAAKEAIRTELKGYEAAIKDEQKRLVQENPRTLAASIMRMSMTIDPTDVYKADGSLDSGASYYNYRKHFWDNVDLGDERILRTPVFQNKFDEYVGRVIPQTPDTIAKLVDELIGRMSSSHELFKFAVNNITHKYETSDIMGMDAVFVHMAKTYYCPPQKSKASWMAQDKLEKLCERAEKMAPLVIGAKAKDIILTDSTEQKWISMNKLSADYILLVFWDPHCGTCKKHMPELYKEYKETLKGLGVEVFAVAKATDPKLFSDWKKFVRENKLDWVNVGLTPGVYEGARQASYNYVPKLTTIESLNYADTWDVYSTPKYFLLDKDRKIVGKQLGADQLADLIRALEQQKTTK